LRYCFSSPASASCRRSGGFIATSAWYALVAHIWGEITYRDIAGAQRESHFCITFDFKDGAWSMADHYNDAT
jgi:hypothetical protein